LIQLSAKLEEGMTDQQLLFQVEIPALGVILAGVRVATIAYWYYNCRRHWRWWTGSIPLRYW